MQVDSILFNDIGEDVSWDGVWDSATKIVPTGGSPKCACRSRSFVFPTSAQHVWGINITRRTVRNNEWVRIVNTKKGETGFVSHFADLDGIDGIHRERPLEIVPYVVGRSDFFTRADRADPLLESFDHRADGGLDLKYASDFESHADRHDQSRLRPGGSRSGGRQSQRVRDVLSGEAAILHRGLEHLRASATRRRRVTSTSSFRRACSIRGASAARRRGRIDADFVAAPADTTILGAAKVTGKAGKGWSIGVLDALTDAERARFASGPITGRQQVEPMTNYFVSRVTKEIGDGTRVGMHVDVRESQAVR